MRTLPPGAKLVLASHNQGKLREIAELMEPLGVEVVSAGALGLPEPDEGEESFEANARIKALAAATASGLPALSDDSGFCVGALGGSQASTGSCFSGIEPLGHSSTRSAQPTRVPAESRRCCCTFRSKVCPRLRIQI